MPFEPPGAKKRQTLIKMIERLDLEIGRGLKAVNEQKIAENALVIMTSNNGGAQEVARNLPLSGAKQELLEGGNRVPFIFRWSGVLPEGKEFTAPVTAMELTATVAAAGNAKPRQDTPFDSVDLLPALTGKEQLEADRGIFFRRRIRGDVNKCSIQESARSESDAACSEYFDWKFACVSVSLGT